MGYLLAGLAGAGNAASDIADKYIDQQFEQQRQANLQRLADSKYQRSRSDHKADVLDSRAYSEEQAKKQREQALSDASALLEANKTKRQNDLADYESKKKIDARYKTDSDKGKKGFESGEIDIDGTSYTFTLNKDTGETEYTDPRLFVSTISREDAEKRIDRGGLLGVGGISDAEFNAAVENEIELSKPIYKLDPNYIGVPAIDSIVIPPKSKSKPDATTKSKESSNKYLDELNDSNNSLLSFLPDYHADPKDELKLKIKTIKKQVKELTSIRAMGKDKFKRWATEALAVATKSGDNSLVETLKSQLRNLPKD